MGGILFVAIMIAFCAGIGSMLFNMPMLNLFVSGALCTDLLRHDSLSYQPHHSWWRTKLYRRNIEHLYSTV